ncbi:hypothetical protein [Clostridium sp. DJ247]|uniref:hypothetical protein n=1 Tax=Clostridium sp. DJ247 TaxID=2726188 RepID=UPI001626AE35|nr:hypothetical protein [Clostridium sp. DJ247]MBC2578747.1 hypothetical protein [Clostridium sp. DJ247]
MAKLRVIISVFVKKECACYFTEQGSISHYCCNVDRVCLFFEKEEKERCKYFEDCVLNLNADLERGYNAEIDIISIKAEEEKPKPRIKCKRCGKNIEANSNRQEYCESCRKYIKREQARCRQRKRQEKGNVSRFREG